MENIQTNIELFEEKLKQLFKRFEKLPRVESVNNAFVASERHADTYDKIKALIVECNLSSHLTAFHVVSNTHCICFGEDKKTVVIYSPSLELFDYTYDYNSYSLPVIFGKIFHKARLKYSEDGLFYVQKDLRPNHQSKVASLKITSDFRDILQILKLDYQTFKKGFSTFDELFNYILKTPYIKTEVFADLEKEAKMYTLQRFQEYLILNKIQKESEKLTLKRVDEVLPGVQILEKVKEFESLAAAKMAFVDKFDGRTIMRNLPDFDKRKIAVSMSMFKQSFGSIEAYQDFINNNSEQEIIKKFKEVNQLA